MLEVKKPIVIAHRGASRYAPENTMSAFRKAVEMKADGIEIDVHLTSDGHIVVAHDHILGRTCNGTGKIMDLTLNELRKLDFGAWYSKDFEGEKLPLLDEVLSLISASKMMLNIEIKATPGQYLPELDKKVVEAVKSHKLEQSIIISSFNHYVLKDVKKLAPEIKTAPLYVGLFSDIWNYASEIGASAIHPHFGDVTPTVAEGCRRNNIAINAWTIDKEEDIQRAAKLGVNGIITNVPDIALKVIREM